MLESMWSTSGSFDFFSEEELLFPQEETMTPTNKEEKIVLNFMRDFFRSTKITKKENEIESQMLK